jgi:hypothetical protein
MAVEWSVAEFSEGDSRKVGSHLNRGDCAGNVLDIGTHWILCQWRQREDERIVDEGHKPLMKLVKLSHCLLEERESQVTVKELLPLAHPRRCRLVCLNQTLVVLHMWSAVADGWRMPGSETRRLGAPVHKDDLSTEIVEVKAHLRP